MKRWKYIAGLVVLLIGLMTAAGMTAWAASGKTVKVTLNPNKGSVSPKKISVKKSGTYGVLPEPVREGFRFKGWFTKPKGGDEISEDTAYKELKATVLYAHWGTIKYKITYEIDGGYLPDGKKNPSTYTCRKEKTLISAKKKGYTFGGWYTTSNFKRGTKLKKISKGSTGDLTLYAKFTPVTYTIVFKKNNVLSKAVKKITASYGQTVKLPKPSEDAFASWNTASDGSGTQFDGGQKVKNLTSRKNGKVILYADPFTTGNNIRRLFDYFKRIGYTKEAAAAIVGNLMHESGGGYSDVKLNAVEWSTGRGIGMCQWTNTTDMQRRTNFENYCASRGKPWPNQDLKVQVDFLMLELTTTKYGKVWYFLSSQGYPANYEMSHAKFKTLTDVSMAVAVFCANFERPNYQDAGLSQRVQFARHVISNYS